MLPPETGRGGSAPPMAIPHTVPRNKLKWPPRQDRQGAMAVLEEDILLQRPHSRSPCFVHQRHHFNTTPHNSGTSNFWEMWAVGCLIVGGTLILGLASTEQFHRSGRGMCLTSARGSTKLASTESYVQPVYQPYLTACEGHRICSSYRTTYKIAYRQGFKKAPQAMYACCPGWKKISSYVQTCAKEMCKLPCQHGGACSGINKCRCPSGWCGKYCQTDVDECGGVSHGCSHQCVNTAGSYQCDCGDGFAVAADGKSCKSVGKPVHNTAAAGSTQSTAGTSDDTKGEIKELKSRVETLEQKLQLLLAPFYNLLPQAADGSSADLISLLSHSFQQLDRIDSLSEQISFLEERLETCSCKNEV